MNCAGGTLQMLRLLGCVEAPGYLSRDSAESFEQLVGGKSVLAQVFDLDGQTMPLLISILIEIVTSITNW